jgi:hypothetical protein
MAAIFKIGEVVRLVELSSELLPLNGAFGTVFEIADNTRKV